jgi:transposase
LEEAKQDDGILYFVDSAHFVMGAFLAMLWSFVRIFVKTSSGRKRFNVLGALNAVTLQMITVVNETYINDWSVAELFQKLRDAHPGKKVTVVLDNARYQTCYVVKSAAAMLNIRCMYLPPYSPNLNLIERVWKFIRKKCLNCTYYEDFGSFKLAIMNCIGRFDREYREELKSLLTWEFQTFSIGATEEKVA